MLSTVVLPAPFGPIRLVTAPGFASNAHVVRRAHAAERDAEAGPREPAPWRRGAIAIRWRGFGATRRARRAPPQPQRACRRPRPRARSRARRGAARRRRAAGTPRGRRAARAAAPRSPPRRAARRRAGAADHHHQHEQDRLREGEGRRRDEARERREQAPATPAHAAEIANAAVFTRTGVEPIDSAATSESFTARIAAPRSLRARSQNAAAAPRRARWPASATPRSPIPPERRAMPMIPFCPPVDAAPLHRRVLDDEAERDRHHREIRAAHAQRRQREQRAGQRRDKRCDRQRRPEAPLRRGRSGSRPRRRRARRSRHGRTTPAR